jgi:NitT/TauT family transport system substrate-binding protein
VVEQKPADYKKFLPGTKFFELKANVRAFEKADDVHSLYGSGKVISDFLVKAQLIKAVPDYAAALDGAFVQAAAK